MAPAFSNRLSTNYTPSDYEIKDIRALIEEKKAIVDEIDGQIRILIERKAAHTKFIDEHSTLISPVRGLPPDILTSIWSVLVSRPIPQWHRIETLKEELSRQPKHPLVVCSQVCRSWRSVLLGSPSLWSVLDISTPRSPEPPQEPYHFPNGHLPPQALEYYRQEVVKWKETVDRLCRQAIVFLQRSASSPLTISLCISPISPMWLVNEAAECKSSARNLVDILRGERHRWREIRFLSVAAFQIMFLDSIPTTPLDPAKDVSLLETFEQHLCPGAGLLPSGGPTEGRLALAESNILKSPSLRGLRLELQCHDLLTLPVNWTALTCLTITDAFQWKQNDWSYSQLACFQITSTLDLLEQSPSLQRLYIEYWYPEEDEEDSENDYEVQSSTFKSTLSRTVAHPSLRSMGIGGHVIPNGLASHLQLPHLRSLSICTTSAIVLAAGYNGVVEWIERYGPQLTDASFNYSNMANEALERCFSFLPNVTSLKTRAVGKHGVAEYPKTEMHTLPALIGDDVLAKLTPKLNDAGKHQGDCYCLKLERFSGYVGAGEFTQKAFVDFLASRLPVRDAIPGGIDGHSNSALRATGVSSLKDIEMTSEVWNMSRVRGMLEDRGLDLDGCRLHLVYPAPDHAGDYLSHYQNLLDENFLPV